MKVPQHHEKNHRLAVRVVPFLALAAWAARAPAQFDAYENEPINYSTAPVDDPVARLQERLDQGQARLQHDPGHGYLASVLRELSIPASSQVLVFSKTSFQRDRISPAAPRALYFNDSTYIGWVQGGEVVEVASVDSRQGTIFYTLSQDVAEHPRFTRRNAECLQCHASNLTKGVPGLFVRSVYPDADGQPVLKAGTFSTDHSSPLKERWGGWYVSGTHGDQRHMGNTLLLAKSGEPELLDTSSGANVTELGGRVETRPYLGKHSDIAALMVLEHQVQAHNLITSSNYQARLALRDWDAMRGLTGEPAGELSDSAKRRFEYAALPLLKYLLFVDEARLTAPIRGTSGFAEEFSRRGPRDRKGRSLYELDLTRRIFKHPCSFLIYSEGIDGLPPLFRDYFWKRLREVLSGTDQDRAFARLGEADRRTVLEIIADTREGLPAYWKAGEGGEGEAGADAKRARL